MARSSDTNVYTTARLAEDSGLTRSEVMLLTREGVLLPLPEFRHPGRGSTRIYSRDEAAIARLSAELIRRFGVPIRELSHLAALFRNIFAMRNEYKLRDPIEARILVAMLDDIRYDGRFSELPKLLKKYNIDKKEAERLLIKANSFKNPNALSISWWAELEDARLFRGRKFIWLYSTKPGHSKIVFFNPETLSSVSYSPVGLVVDLGTIMMGL